MRRVLASPALHFLALGAVLFAADRWIVAEAFPDERPRDRIEIRAVRIDELRADWAARTGAWPDEETLDALIGAEIDDEILLREARVRGFDVGDPVVRTRLARNIGFISGEDERANAAGDASRVAQALALGIGRGDLVVRRRLIERMRAELSIGEGSMPSESEIAARFARDRARVVGPVRVRLSHVFLSRERRGDAARRGRAKTRRADLRRGARDRGGDRARRCLPARSHAPNRSRTDLERVFGAGFAREVFALEPGRVSAPIPSSYGIHLVWVHERTEAAEPVFAARRIEISAALSREREDAALRAALERLRHRYEIRVEGERS